MVLNCKWVEFQENLKRLHSFRFVIFFLLSGHDNKTLFVAVIALSCVVAVQFLVIGLLLWRKRSPQKTNASENYVANQPGSQHQIPSDATGQEAYMELQPRPSQMQSPDQSEYQKLQGKLESPDYYNIGYKGKNTAQEDGDYEPVTIY